MTIRVILADDHPVVRRGVKNYLDKSVDIHVVGEADNGAQAISLVQSLEPDLLLLDMELPKKNGIQVTEELLSSGMKTKILILSGHTDKEFIQGILNLGAAGYLTKDESLETIANAIRGVSYGQKGWLSRKVSAVVMELYQDEDGGNSKITPREAEVHNLIYQGKTNKGIAFDLKISEKTVEKYIYSLFQKLEVASRVQLAVKKAREKSEEEKGDHNM